MTRKRKTRCPRKQETQIRTRLIELLLKVDDLIYHQKPISMVEAETYIIEVNSYKACVNDERSLQVIEKLSRCMKAIIVEHQEQANNNYETINENVGADDIRADTVSPVYSLPDEDRTQFTQEVDRPVIETILDNNIVQSSSELNDDSDRTQYTQAIVHDIVDNNISNNENKEVVDLCSDDDYDECNDIEVNMNIDASNVNADVEIHKALSNLSIKPTGNDEMATDVECSQSILNNFEDLNKSKQSNSEETALPTDNSIKIYNKPPIVVQNPIQTTKPLILKPNIKIVTFNKNNLNNPLILNVSKAITTTMNPDKTAQFPKDITPKETNTVITKQIHSNIQKANSNLTQNTNIDNTVTNDTITELNNISKITKNIKQIAETKTKIKENIGKENTPIVKRKRAPRKKKEVTKSNDSKTLKADITTKQLNNNNNIATFKTPVRKTYSKKKVLDKTLESSIPIYNKNIENDLSWLEGIRFVREVRDDEYDRTLTNIDDTFWDNYYLPPNFDENDFL